MVGQSEPSQAGFRDAATRSSDRRRDCERWITPTTRSVMALEATNVAQPIDPRFRSRRNAAIYHLSLLTVFPVPPHAPSLEPPGQQRPHNGDRRQVNAERPHRHHQPKALEPQVVRKSPEEPEA